MTLTEDQRAALMQGQAVPVTDSENQLDCVLVRADVFERVRNLLLNDQPLSEDERRAAILAAGIRANWDDPALDVYEKYRQQG